jgi:protein SCO1
VVGVNSREGTVAARPDSTPGIVAAMTTSVQSEPRGASAATADTAGLPDVRLRDSGGRRFRTSDLLGGPVALSFFSTRCPAPDACPRLARLLSETQEMIGTPTALRGRARLLTVTLDPAYDTPARLARYGREREADPALWVLATGDSAALAGLRRAAHLAVHGSGARLSHGQVLVVYRPDGRQFRRVQGLRWTPRELAQILEEASR